MGLNTRRLTGAKMDQELRAAANDVFLRLRRARRRLVLAESCSGGLVAAALVGVPGISEWLCGSAVTYRDDTKHRWLGVSQAALSDPAVTAVSEFVACQMASGVLQSTPEADLAVVTTGHLGPGAPAGQDGLVFLGVANRSGTQVASRAERHILTSPEPTSPADAEGRQRRQREAALLALRCVVRELDAKTA